MRAPLDILAPLFRSEAFWRGAIAARDEPAATGRLRLFQAIASTGGDVTAHPEFARWLAYTPGEPRDTLDLRR